MKNKKDKIFIFVYAIVFFLGVLFISQNAFASSVIIGWDFPVGSKGVADIFATANNSGKLITVTGTNAPTYDSSIRATGWSNGNNAKYWQIEFDSTGYKNLKFSSKQRSSSTGPKNFNLQYKIGVGGSWTSIDGGDVVTADNFTSGVLNDIDLPAICDNQESVYLRWVMSSNLAVNGGAVGSTGASNIDDIMVSGEPLDNSTEQSEEDPVTGCTTLSQDIKFNELFPYAENDAQEYVELKNYDETCLDLSGWRIEDASNHKYFFPEGTIIDSESFFTVNQDLSMNNTSDSMHLFDSNGKEADKVSYDGTIKNYSFSFDGDNWQWTSIQTPNKENEFDEAEEDIKEEEKENSNTSEYNIRLNELLPNPKGDERSGEYIEIYNGENFAIDLESWILKDSSKTKFTFPAGSVIKPNGYLAVYKNDFIFTLNNSGSETVTLLDSDGNVISTVSYENAKENMSYSFNGKSWQWSKDLTPGADNKLSKPSKIEVRKIKSAYVGVPVVFEASIKTKKKRKNKAELNYHWNFGDKKSSYLQKVNHVFQKTGKYKITLTVDENGQATEKSFSVKVKKYPQLSVAINRLLPNPGDNDSESEWIELTNLSKQKVNLRGWKIATGKKNMLNHTILTDFFIEPGKVAKLTRQQALFSLNNKAATIELRYPNGKTSSQLEYEKDKITEDEICQNTHGHCSWSAPIISEQIEDEDVESDVSNDVAIEATKDEVKNSVEGVEQEKRLETNLQPQEDDEKNIDENTSAIIDQDNENNLEQITSDPIVESEENQPWVITLIEKMEMMAATLMGSLMKD